MTAREVSLKTLMACESRGSWSDEALGSALAKSGLDTRDAALATRLCYGVLQNRLFCDYYIDSFSRVKTEKMDVCVRCVLRLGAYQLLLLDRIPASAAVNESVALARKYARSPRAAGFVNAVLRALARSADSLPPLPEGDEVRRLSIRYSHPEWLVRAFLDRFGGETEALLAADNAPAPTTLQTNTLRTSPEALLASLREHGVQAEPHPTLPGCLTMTGSGAVDGLEEFTRGEFYVQDAAARCAVLASGVKAGDRVLDACAAPGGKSFAAAVQMGGEGEIIACDIHENKLRFIESGAQRLGIHILRASLRDAREAFEPFRENYGAVLCDVPCSGLGVIRKKPDIRYKDPAPLKALPEIQLAILENCCTYVRPGGTLLYSTCTVLREENEGVVERFLQKHHEFAPADFSVPLPEGESAGGCLTFLPHVQGTDGFFAAKLKKAER